MKRGVNSLSVIVPDWGLIPRLISQKLCVRPRHRCPGRKGVEILPAPPHTLRKEVRRMNVVSMEQKENQSEALKDKYLLTIKEAAFYFNIGTKKMRRIAEDNLGNVAVFCGNRFLIVRPKFEEFILQSSEI